MQIPFSQMLDKEDIDKITVTKLIAECHISSRHFIITLKGYYGCAGVDVPTLATQELVQKSLNEEDRLGALTTYVAFVRQNRKKFERFALFPPLGSDRGDACRGGNRISGAR